MLSIASRAHALWLLIQEPRVVALIHFVAYLITGALGIYMLSHPPMDVTSALGTAVTTIWAVLLILGGGLGAVAVLPGIWWVERAAVASCITGVVLYMVAVIANPRINPGDDVILLALMAIAVAFFAVRWFRIRRYAYDPER